MRYHQKGDPRRGDEGRAVNQDKPIESAINHSMTLCLALLAAEGAQRDVIDHERQRVNLLLRKPLVDCIRLDIQRLEVGHEAQQALAQVILRHCQALGIEVKL